MSSGRRLAAIIFTDLQGFTADAHRDEGVALTALEEQKTLLEPILATYRGRAVKSMGDGLLLEFPNARDAVNAAVALQQSIREHNAREGVLTLRMRIGVHVGDVEDRAGDIIGDAVNIASRIEPLAEPGGICLSAQAFDQVHNKVPYRLDPIGAQSLKGIRETVQVYRLELPWAETLPTPSNVTTRRLAVLPLANISPDPRDEYLADGLTEELIATTSRIHGLRVISRTTVARYKATPKSVAEIGSELGVDSILEGSVRKAGDRLRITVQLIDPRTDEHRWSETYDRRLEDVFAVQSEIAESTARALRVKLLNPELVSVRSRPTRSFPAYEAYLRGIEMSQRWSRSGGADMDREIEGCFEQAIREDPEFAAAYSRLALHLIFAAVDYRPAKEAYPRARKLIDKATELEHESSGVHLALGELAWQVDRDWVKAEDEYRRAISLNPSDSLARWAYGCLLMMLQRFAEAEREMLEGVEIDPLASSCRWGLVGVYLCTGDSARALDAGKKLVAMQPEYPGGRGILAQAYLVAGQPDHARQTVQPLSNGTDLWSRFNFSHVMAHLGDTAPGRSLLADWEAGRLSEPLPTRYAAVLCAAMGSRVRALELLERSQAEDGAVMSLEYLFPDFDSIRNEPRFVAILNQGHLPTTLPPRMLASERRKAP